MPRLHFAFDTPLPADVVRNPNGLKAQLIRLALAFAGPRMLRNQMLHALRRVSKAPGD
jgi:hypothetical protein